MIELVFSEHPTPDRKAALVLTGRDVPAEGFAAVRHAGTAAAIRHGTCPCCRRPSGVVAVLRDLALQHARGSAEFSRVVVAGPAEMRASVADDPIVAARYRLGS